MKTPTEKAKELVERYNSIDVELDSKEGWYSSDLRYLNVSKQCALIVAEEVLLTHTHKDNIGLGGYSSKYVCEYWNEVKSEIMKL